MANKSQVCIRGLETNRTGQTPDAGSFLYTTDSKQVWVGDGSTAGGIRVTTHGGDLKADGTVPLTSDWDVGAFDVTAVDLTATGRVYAADTVLTTDASFYMGAGSNATPRINFDDSDWFEYDRTANQFQFFINAVLELEISATQINFQSNSVVGTGTIRGANTSPTEALAGVIELATQAETNTGTDDQRAVTPLKLATYSGNRLMDSLPDADHTTSGDTFEMQAQITMAYGNFCYLDATASQSKLDLSDADAAATMPIFAMAIEAITADTTGTWIRKGFVRDDTWAWATIGATLYAGTTIGAIQDTVPTGSGDQVQIVGFVVATDYIYFDPSPNVLEIA